MSLVTVSADRIALRDVMIFAINGMNIKVGSFINPLDALYFTIGANNQIRFSPTGTLGAPQISTSTGHELSLAPATGKVILDAPSTTTPSWEAVVKGLGPVYAAVIRAWNEHNSSTNTPLLITTTSSIDKAGDILIKPGLNADESRKTGNYAIRLNPSGSANVVIEQNHLQITAMAFANGRLAMFLPNGQLTYVNLGNSGDVLQMTSATTFAFNPPGAGTTETASHGLNKIGNDIRLGGALLNATDANIVGNNSQSVRFGDAANKLYQFLVNASYRVFIVAGEYISLEGGVRNLVNYASDADFTATLGMHTITLPPITANRTFTFPSPVQDGVIYRILNRNNTGFTWSITGPVVDKLDVTLPAFANQTSYTVQGMAIPGRSAEWRILSIY